MSDLWNNCISRLEQELTSLQLVTWIRPLHASELVSELALYAPNRYVLDHVRGKYLPIILATARDLGYEKPITLRVGTAGPTEDFGKERTATESRTLGRTSVVNEPVKLINSRLTFENFIEGKSNRLARAAAKMVAESFGPVHNPLLIYGGVGLGKTHLLHALGNFVISQAPSTTIAVVSAERFVSDMVNALRTHTMDRFKSYYRTAKFLLVDDVQFLAGKEQSQEEFFHVFNAMWEGNNQIVLTCDRFPKDIKGLEDRLKTRFAWGLAVAVEPPDLETRVAIVMSKASHAGIKLSEEVGFFIANRIHSNIRELEGALKLVLAFANFTKAPITKDMAKEALKDILRFQHRFVSFETIQQAVAEYYRLRLSELTSKSRKRQIARPRQMAMALAKELTPASYPEIGSAFGGRDHTTVLHACRRIEELSKGDEVIAQDYKNLMRILGS